VLAVHMQSETTALNCFKITELALMLFRPAMSLQMGIEVSLRVECLVTLGAIEGFFPSVFVNELIIGKERKMLDCKCHT